MEDLWFAFVNPVTAGFFLCLWVLSLGVTQLHLWRLRRAYARAAAPEESLGRRYTRWNLKYVERSLAKTIETRRVSLACGIASVVLQLGAAAVRLLTT